jgi:F0F1-type ATP synthase membrane subunit b/b'
MVLAFIIAMLILVKTTHKIINNILSKKIEDVVSEIDNSVEVLNDSSALFDEATQERSSIEKKLVETSSRVKNEDEAYYEKYIADLNSRAKSGKESFDNYLDIQYKLSILNHKKDIINSSLNNVLDYINNLDSKQQSKLVDSSIENFASKL